MGRSEIREYYGHGASRLGPAPERELLLSHGWVRVRWPWEVFQLVCPQLIPLLIIIILQVPHADAPPLPHALPSTSNCNSVSATCHGL